ncbi:DUF2884 family protein [Providencia vermicola]|uniref:DUF2884 family protein n=2 Tax=Providencia TaxID=586 RepID=A0AAI9I0I1_PROST|nr:MULTISPECIES: DUF2884 family protein [Providencia]ELR5036015.1 DUF2884 family protein [Providencia stuartii]ELR5123022.1 DUF2884 family protein [Providencia stuartii]ELR5123507.1 DUF2884 family protein [Providencia stuartii]ELR5142874.1 DUF2884 family protein [Providencia stuartii]ELR5292342.1 DUF2884 family protein [Providencia stuartii]
MLRRTLIAFSLLACATSQAADYKCSVTPKDDIFMTPENVQVIGRSGDLKITPNGDVTLNGQSITLTEQQRQQAIRYQTAVRNDLPWIKQETQQKLSVSKNTLDKVVIRVIGEDSNVRKRLSKLENDLNGQINQVIETRPNGYAFHHDAINKVETQGRQLVNDSLGGILQDSINEMGRKQLLSGGDSSKALQGLLGNLGGLQQDLEAEWKKQENSFQQFGQQVCGKVTSLEQQRIALMNALK